MLILNSFSFEDKNPRFTSLKAGLALRLLSKGLFYIRAMLRLKLLWIFVILVMTGLSIAFLVSNTNQYFEARLVTNIESSSADLSVSIFISDKVELFRLVTD